MAKSSTQFTAIIRLPFLRADFLDPTQTDWDSLKDRALWGIVSESSNQSDLDWEGLATVFHVSPKFILQQAAWLYARHLDHVRAQMKRVGGGATTGTGCSSGATQSLVPGIKMRLTRDMDSKAPTGSSVFDQQHGVNHVLHVASEDDVPPSSHFPTQVSTIPSVSQPQSWNRISQQNLVIYHHSASEDGVPHPPSFSAQGKGASRLDDPTDSPSSSTTTSSGSQRDRSSSHGQSFRRPPRFNSHSSPLAAYDRQREDHIEERSGGASLAFAHLSTSRHAHPVKAPEAVHVSPYKHDSDRSLEAPFPQEIHSTSVVSDDFLLDPKREGANVSYLTELSSAGNPVYPSKSAGGRRGPKSPTHTAYGTTHVGLRSRINERSEDVISAGSSFSDIEDTSVTQSALEEALLSNLQHGRMSTLSQLRSRYLQ